MVGQLLHGDPVDVLRVTDPVVHLQSKPSSHTATEGRFEYSRRQGSGLASKASELKWKRPSPSVNCGSYPLISIPVTTLLSANYDCHPLPQTLKIPTHGTGKTPSKQLFKKSSFCFRRLVEFCDECVFTRRLLRAVRAAGTHRRWLIPGAPAPGKIHACCS